MRVACVYVPHLPVAVERAARPGLDGQPVIVGDRKVVHDCSGEAAAAGVAPGMSIREALARCPGAVFLPPRSDRYERVFERATVALERVSPVVEPHRPDRWYVDLRGLDAHYPDAFALAGALVTAVRDATGLLPSAGVGSGKFAAWAAAVTTEPGDACVVTPGREEAFLAPLDIGLLPVSERTVARLRRLALTRIGDVARIGIGPLQAQFGREGARLWELARGADADPVVGRTPRETLVEAHPFDTPTANTAALVAAGQQLLRRLLRRLGHRAARVLTLTLLTRGETVWERRETLRDATNQPQRLDLVLRTRLTFLTLPEPVDELRIALEDLCAEGGRQGSLFPDARDAERQIVEAIRQLRARYGRPALYKIVEVDPWSPHPEERMALLPLDA